MQSVSWDVDKRNHQNHRGGHARYGRLEEASVGGQPLKDIYGRKYASNPENFKFMEGETLCLLDLAGIIQNRGINNFLKKAKRQHQRQQRNLQPPIHTSNIEGEIDGESSGGKDVEMELHARKLQEKILLHFTSL